MAADDIFTLSIANLANEVYAKYLRVPFPLSTPLKQNADPYRVHRHVHGAMHATRVAIYTSIVTNLYQLLGDPQARDLTASDIRCLEIAALFHDAGRQRDDNEDHNEIENAKKALEWLREKEVSQEDVSQIIRIIINKNYVEDNTLYDYVNGDFIRTDAQIAPKLVFLSKMLNAADCLDILRCCRNFNRGKFVLNEHADHLFFKSIDSEIGFDLFIERLVLEVNLLLEKQQDLLWQYYGKKKFDYEYHENLYSQSIDDLDDLPLLKKLYEGGLNKEEDLEKTFLAVCQDLILPMAEHFKEAPWFGATLTRGVWFGTTQMKMIFWELKYLFQEGGNPSRSIAVTLKGRVPLAPFGFLISRNLTIVRTVNEGDFASGHGMKIMKDPLSPAVFLEKLSQEGKNRVGYASSSTTGYMEIEADLQPACIEGFYYILNDTDIGSNIKLEYRIFCYYLQQLFSRTSGDGHLLPIYEWNVLTDTKTEQFIELAEVQGLAKRKMSVYIDLALEEDKRSREEVLSFPEKNSQAFINKNPFLASMIDIFDLKEMVPDYIKNKVARAYDAFLKESIVTKTFFQWLKAQKNAGISIPGHIIDELPEVNVTQRIELKAQRLLGFFKPKILMPSEDSITSTSVRPLNTFKRENLLLIEAKLQEGETLNRTDIEQIMKILKAPELIHFHAERMGVLKTLLKSRYYDRLIIQVFGQGECEHPDFFEIFTLLYNKDFFYRPRACEIFTCQTNLSSKYLLSLQKFDARTLRFFLLLFEKTPLKPEGGGPDLDWFNVVIGGLEMCQDIRAQFVEREFECKRFLVSLKGLVIKQLDSIKELGQNNVLCKNVSIRNFQRIVLEFKANKSILDESEMLKPLTECLIRLFEAKFQHENRGDIKLERNEAWFRVMKELDGLVDEEQIKDERSRASKCILL